MCEPARMIAYQKSWTQVKLAYAGGFVVSERGLQAVLYSALQAHLPGIDIGRRTNMGNGWWRNPQARSCLGRERGDYRYL